MPAPWRTPFASSPALHRRMASQRRRDTDPELAIRRKLHARGLRFFVHRRPLPQLRREADVVFPRAHLAVFVDGCFWHGCPLHGVSPRVNSDYWRVKLEGNRARDEDTNLILSSAGWRVFRAWEHEDPSHVADQIEAIVAGSSNR